MQRLHADPSGVHSFASAVEGHSTLPFALAFPPSPTLPHLLAVADEDGFLTLLNPTLPSPPSPLHNLHSSPSSSSTPAHSNAIFDLTFSPTSSHIATASADQTVRLFDVATSSLTFSFTAHTGSVKAVAASPHPDVFASGSRDGTARVWDVRAGGGHEGVLVGGLGGGVGKKRGRRAGASPMPLSHSVTSVAFIGGHSLLSSSSTSPTLRLHDLRYTAPAPLHSLHPPATPTQRLYGTASMDYHEGRHAVVVAYTNHTAVVWGLRGEGGRDGGVVEEVWRGGHKANFYTRVRWEEGGEQVACGSTDGGVWVYGRGRARAVKVLRGHEEEVGCVAWSRSERFMLASGADDHTVRLWKASGAERREEEEEVEEEDAQGEADAEVEEEMEVEDKENDAPADDGSPPAAAADTATSYPSLPSHPLRDVSNQGEVRVVRKKPRLNKRGRSVATPASAPPRTRAALLSSTGQPMSRRVRTLLELWALPPEGREELQPPFASGISDMDTAEA